MPRKSRDHVFICYSHADKKWLELLKIHLKPLIREERVIVWDDTMIRAGMDWRSEIGNAIDSAKVAVLLVSPNLLASDFVAEEEMPRLLQAASTDGLTVTWVALRESSFKRTPIERYQAANDPSKPLASLKQSERDATLVSICETIEQLFLDAPETAGQTVKNGRVSHQGRKAVILYAPAIDADAGLMKSLEARLTQADFEVFAKRHPSVGLEWASSLGSKIVESDVVIPLLSPESVLDPMILSEIQLAQESRQQNSGRPVLIPVLLAGVTVSAPLATLFQSGAAIRLEEGRDREAILDLVLKAVECTSGAPLPGDSESIGGAVPLDSRLYVARSTDDEFYAAIARRQSIVLLKAARQMGKTSLLARGLQKARENSARAIFTDFQGLDSSQLDSLFIAMAETIADQLGLEVSVHDIWNPRSGPSVNFERFMRRYLFPVHPSPIVWGLDEVDRIFPCSFAGDVFGLFRSWHNARSLDPLGPWRRLTMAIAYATEAHLFITNLNQSPFNVGTQLVLRDFSVEQTADLNDRHRGPLHGSKELTAFHRLLGGQPYLVRRGLHEMMTRGLTFESFEAQADRDDGPMGSHLRRVLVSLAQDQSLVEVVRCLLRNEPINSEVTLYRLRAAGVIADDPGEQGTLRCPLYEKYLTRHLL